MKGLFCALAALVLLAPAALAGPPSVGWTGSFHSKQIILCDTREQVAAIVEAGQESALATRAKFFEYYGTINARGEPTCSIGSVLHVRVTDVIDLGEFDAAAGRARGWALHVVDMRGIEGWLLYASKVEGVGI